MITMYLPYVRITYVTFVSGPKASFKNHIVVHNSTKSWYIHECIKWYMHEKYNKSCLIMIRDICENDFQAVADIYNYYIINTVTTFEVPMEMLSKLYDYNV